MKFYNIFLSGLATVGCAIAYSTPLRNIIYFDQYHRTILPGKNVTAGITHVIMAFANSSLFVPETAGTYEPFMPLSDVRALFDSGTQVGIALGGWADTAGFSAGAKTETSRKAFAENLAKMIEDLGFDFVDIDWEYPGGNGADYKQIPNANKTGEITTFPLLLHAIKHAIAPKLLTIAAPAMERDFIAYTPTQAPKIWSAVDFVNVMTYDMMYRRDNATLHHTSVKGSLEAVQRYLNLGLPASKINLGFAYYAKYFQTPANVTCTHPIGCPIVKAELDDGTDAGTSGTVTFERANLFPPGPPTNLTTSTDDTCGLNTAFTCSGLADKGCCSQYGFCGTTAAHCGIGCQRDYGTCKGPDVSASFLKALKQGVTDEEEGGQWFWDSEALVFWTWDTVELMQRKIAEIVTPLGLGGVFAWSLGEDSADWSHIQAISAAVKGLTTRTAAVEDVAPKILHGRVMRPHGSRYH
ncbi:glycoside hydrolase family 18 protein [Whalleya microplaca]|nr:glycoside hydrolase family 18 protein [Whalleya microplaca]